MALHYPFFKAYDVRGRVPDELNPDMARRIGAAFATARQPRSVAVGHDMRLSSRELADAVIEGLTSCGVDVIDIGLCGTEEVYYAAFDLPADGGIMVTASHNPADYNGFKFVGPGAVPISSDDGLNEIETLVFENEFPVADVPGQVREQDRKHRYAAWLASRVDTSVLKPLKIVVNGGNGSVGPLIDALEPHLPFQLIRVHCSPDGRLPNGVPNPLLPENRAATADAVRSAKADLGVAWDGDFDRCFLFDAQGRFVEGYYIVGLIAEAMLKRDRGAHIVHDPRLTWNTIDMVRSAGGIPVQSKTGHAFIKSRMRAEDALYGGEMSAHHYFRDFAYCDNGNLPWLLVAQLMCEQGRSLASLLEERIERFPVSGEINRKIDDPQAALKTVEARYAPDALKVEHVDGLSVEYADWRFNLRLSNTEPLVRLNVESRGNPALMQDKTEELLSLIDSQQGTS